MLMKLPFLQIIFTSFTTQAQYFPWISLTNLKSEYIFCLKNCNTKKRFVIAAHSLCQFLNCAALALQSVNKSSTDILQFFDVLFFKKWLNGNCLKRISNL